jgi:hypothetical protein
MTDARVSHLWTHYEMISSPSDSRCAGCGVLLGEEQLTRHGRRYRADCHVTKNAQLFHLVDTLCGKLGMTPSVCGDSAHRHLPHPSMEVPAANNISVTCVAYVALLYPPMPGRYSTCRGHVILPTEVVSTIVVYGYWHKRCTLTTQDGTQNAESGRRGWLILLRSLAPKVAS